MHLGIYNIICTSVVYNIYIRLAEMRFGFPSDANRRVGNLFRFRTK